MTPAYFTIKTLHDIGGFQVPNVSATSKEEKNQQQQKSRMERAIITFPYSKE